jgi:hypothetical protein
MNTRLRKKLLLLFAEVGIVFVVTFFLNACSTISPYSETAYQQATSLKAESLALVSKANEPFTDHAKDVASLKLDLSKAYEYAKGRPNNQISVNQWNILLAPTGHSLESFLERWQSMGKLNPIFVQEASTQIGQEFDTISGLESGKTKEGN